MFYIIAHGCVWMAQIATSPCVFTSIDSELGGSLRTSGSDVDTANDIEEAWAEHIARVKRSQVSGLAAKETYLREDEDEDENHGTWSMTSICSFRHALSMRRYKSCFDEELFDCCDFRSTTGSEDDIADMLLLGSDDEEDF